MSAEGVKPEEGKVNKIKSWPQPTCVKDVGSFLGLCSYYRRFIKGFSTIARPLTQLTEAGVRFEWTEECRAAFEKLKADITSDSVMAYPMAEGLFILDTDASSTGIGAVLSQVQWNEELQKDVERPVTFASKTLNKAQRRYCVTRREMLAVVFFSQYFKHFLLGRSFLIRVDHSALRWMWSFCDPQDQVARWLELMSVFDFSIEHRNGTKHGNADAMSRVPCDPEECACYDET